MRGTDTKQSPEWVEPAEHLIRQVKALTDEAVTTLAPTFEAMYASVGRPSIPPERPLKAMLLMAL